MRCEWRPETPEEIAEHQRMRRELLESQQIQDNKIVNYKAAKTKRRGRWSRSVTLMVLIIFAAFYFIGKADLSGLYGIFANFDVPAGVSEYQLGKSVSENTSNYIQQNNKVIEAWEDINTRFYSKVLNGTVVMCNDSAEIETLMDSITQLKQLKIDANDFKDYQVACDEYYGEFCDFFNDFSKKHYVSVKKYNKFVLKINSLQSPYDCLVNIFKEKNYYYYIDSNNKVHYKYDRFVL